jgi:biotin carboxylase
MSHLLMIESWVGPTGRRLPATIARLGHCYTFVTRKRQHYLDARSREIHPLFEHADHVLTAETNDLPQLIAFLRREHEILAFDGVVTVCDYYIDTVSEVARALDLPSPFAANVRAVHAKHLMRQALDRAGIPNPAYAVTESWQETREAAARIGYPTVIKPTDLASSAFVRLARDEAELHDAFSSLAAFGRNFRDQPRAPVWLLEEFMAGEEVSVEAITCDGEMTIIGITDKSVTGSPYFIEDGHMFPAALEPERASDIERLVLQALRAVHHDRGVSHTEVKLTPAGPRIVEINPRPPGNYIVELVEHVTGIDLLEAYAELSLGRRPTLARRNTEVTSAAIKFLVPRQGGLVATVEGADSLSRDDAVVAWAIGDVAGREVPAPIDNACYAGHVIAVDRDGLRAREYAERALARVQFTFGDPMASQIRV